MIYVLSRRVLALFRPHTGRVIVISLLVGVLLLLRLSTIQNADQINVLVADAWLSAALIPNY